MDVDQIHDYKQDGEAHAGAFGTVWKARHQTLGTTKAVKRLHDYVLPKIIEEEARKQQAVKSPYVVQIHDYFAEDRAIVMEWCPTGLEEYLRDRFGGKGGGLPFEEAREILHALLQGLNDAHKAEVIHGDIKPANMRRGEDGLWKIGDFGAARRVRETTPVKGSTNWMAPEVLAGGPATEESDYFSFGIVAYLVFSGRHPFYAGDPSCLTSEEDNIRSATFRADHLSTLCPHIPGRVGDLVMELLSHAPNRAKAEQALKAALSQLPNEEKERPSIAPPAPEQPTAEEMERLQQAYAQAAQLFFQWYRPKDAVDLLTGFLRDFEWDRFKGANVARLADAWSLRAYINNSAGFFTDAIEASTNGLSVQSEHVNSLHARGYAQIQLGDYESARSDLETALELTDDPRKRRQISQLLTTVAVRAPAA